MSIHVEAARPAPDGPPWPGHTRVSAAALNSTARAVAGDLFGVDPYVVRVFMRDDAGYLALAINLPLPLTGAALRRGDSLLDAVRAQRMVLGERFTALTGAMVSRVDVRITGVVADDARETP